MIPPPFNHLRSHPVTIFFQHLMEQENCRRVAQHRLLPQGTSDAQSLVPSSLKPFKNAVSIRDTRIFHTPEKNISLGQGKRRDGEEANKGKYVSSQYKRVPSTKSALDRYPHQNLLVFKNLDLPLTPKQGSNFNTNNQDCPAILVKHPTFILKPPF